MGRKVKIGITRDFFDEKGKFIMPGPGLKLLDEIPNTEYQIFPEYLPEITPQQIPGFDMVLTRMPKWTMLSSHHMPWVTRMSFSASC